MTIHAKRRRSRGRRDRATRNGPAAAADGNDDTERERDETIITDVMIRRESGQYDAELVRALRLSSKRLTSTNGLEKCVGLIRLDLSSNRIRSIGDGLKTLTKLEALDVSKNWLTGIPARFIGNDDEDGEKNLRTLKLGGNRIGQLDDLSNLAWFTNLRDLSFRCDGGEGGGGERANENDSNPVCHDERKYYEAVCDACPNLVFLDGESVELKRAATMPPLESEPTTALGKDCLASAEDVRSEVRSWCDAALPGASEADVGGEEEERRRIRASREELATATREFDDAVIQAERLIKEGVA